MLLLTEILESLSIFIIYIFFFNDTATTEIYTLSLHDALPISLEAQRADERAPCIKESEPQGTPRLRGDLGLDRKSTRLNSSHLVISYAVFCLKKKKMKSHSYIWTFLPVKQDNYI